MRAWRRPGPAAASGNVNPVNEPESGGGRRAQPCGGDATVIAALALGWEMADLYVVRDLSAPARELTATLPAAGELGSRQQVHATVARIRALLGHVLDEPGAVTVPSTHALGELPEGEGDAWSQTLLDFHVELSTALRAIGLAPWHAYDLGRSLAELCREPEDLSKLMDRLDAPSVLPIQAQLADLSSRLPLHSAAAVSATLEQWRGWAGDARARENMTDVRAALARQGTLWRSLLTGDKDASQMLDPDTVIAASVRHASRLGTLMQGMAGAYLPAVALVALVVALLVYAIIVQSGIATVIAALGALAAVLVVIRRTLALIVGDTIEELRGGLWAAEIDGAVAQSILNLPPPAPTAPQPKVTLAKPPASQPGAVRTGITHRVERALHVTRSARTQGFRVPASGPPTPASDASNGASGTNGTSAP
jgi:hypothetical protein